MLLYRLSVRTAKIADVPAAASEAVNVNAIPLAVYAAEKMLLSAAAAVRHEQLLKKLHQLLLHMKRHAVVSISIQVVDTTIIKC